MRGIGFALLVAVLAAVGVIGGRVAYAQDEIVGLARAVSGDTIIIKSIDDGKITQMRLYGVMAPDLRQHCETSNGEPVNCGYKSFDALDTMIQRKRMTCVDLEKDSTGHLTGTCYLGDKILNSLIVRDGWALAYVDETPDFLGLEERARAAGRGVMIYRFEKPWIWRAEQEKAKSGN
jgi:endonuclease YncB( thermonuclease family)